MQTKSSDAIDMLRLFDQQQKRIKFENSYIYLWLQTHPVTRKSRINPFLMEGAERTSGELHHGMNSAYSYNI